ncbi:nitrile hydratase subunit alpha [Roseisalinus antarcticus]|uniref:nitrile hydratase n=1 Tax=Roseisalinus antarcticus TaxID=254357 RepID=A0A1Y5RWY3_9RHOB|nr:nitrile hydratase subunit alpha [Roseisalinus antarcticus]SLN27211.1 Low-molecular weight cobalt-containing nitrile hydratase subunit alpha [Roseisalinus antarcticus]
MAFDRDKTAHIHRELHSHLPPDPALRVKALESLAVERGYVARETLDAWIEAYSERIGPKRGAEVVARSWVAPDFRQRLLDNAGMAVREFGYEGHATGHLKAVENSDSVQNLVVCTLCSCYPFALLGMSPIWYRSAAYRARAVREPRKVLAEFGVTLPEAVGVRVWDSTAELRYLVVPQRPAGTEGWPEDRLAALVTRNAMIGTQRDLALPDTDGPG